MPHHPSRTRRESARSRILSAWAGFLAVASALALGVGALGLGGCDSDSPTQPAVPLDSIFITSPAETLLIGATVQFAATAFDTSGTLVSSPSLSWSSSDPSIAAVDFRGRVTGVGEGTATITASGGGATSNGVLQLVLQGFGWVSQRGGTPTVNNLSGVHFVDRMRGWAVGELGTILFTSNSGVLWEQQQSNSTGYRLNAVHFVTSDHGFVVGSAGRLLETVDGGDDWDPVAVDASGQELNDVHFVDDLKGFIVGNGGVILRTQDGGANWTRYIPSVTTQNLRSVWAVEVSDTVHAWACGDLGTIVGTEDDGDLWTIVTPSVVSDPLRAVVRRSVDEAIAVGLNNRIANTAPGMGGPVWSLSGVSSEFASFHGAAWPDAARAYAAGINQLGNANVQVSADGGFTWTTQPLPGDAPLTGNELRAVWFVDADYGWAVGRGGLVVHTATGGF